MLNSRLPAVLAGLLAQLALAGAVCADAGHMHSAAPHWMAPPAEARRPNPVPRDAASIERGTKLFVANCASCHGAGGRGDGPAGKTLQPRPADLTQMAGAHPDGDFAWKIENGRGPMPAWKGRLETRQVWDLVNFIQNLALAGAAPQTGHAGMQH